MNEAAESYRLADAGELRESRFALDLLLVERADGPPRGRWYLAGSLWRSAGEVGWFGEPMKQDVEVAPELAWEYWSEKDGNGYSYAVFYYWVESPSAAAELVEARRSELEQGANPYYGQAEEVTAVPNPVEPAHAALVTPAPEPEDDQSEPDPHAGCEERALTHSMSQAVILRLASELVRRHPMRLWLNIEGGGMYDRINVIDISEPDPKHIATFNAAGSNTMTAAGTGFLWTSALRNDNDPADWVREFERRCALPPPKGRLPASTPASLAVRWVSTFLTSQIGSRRPWLTLPAHHFDPDDAAKAFPAAAAWRPHQPHLQGALIHLGHLNESKPRIIVSATGDLWRDNGQHHRLPSLHLPGAPITALLLRTVPDLVP